MELIPFDGFLFASCVMVAKEAHTSPAVKDLIVAAASADDSQWEGTYEGHQLNYHCALRAQCRLFQTLVPGEGGWLRCG